MDWALLIYNLYYIFSIQFYLYVTQLIIVKYVTGFIIFKWYVCILLLGIMFMLSQLSTNMYNQRNINVATVAKIKYDI